MSDFDAISYSPSTGEFRWRVQRGPRKAGELAGCIDKDGYRLVCVNGKQYRAHVLAWFLVHGEWVDEIDHADLNRSNNAIGNLRPCTRSQNTANHPRRATNTSGHKGVYWCSQRGRWRARIKINYRSIHLGFFDTASDAGAAYKTAADVLFAEFARA